MTAASNLDALLPQLRTGAATLQLDLSDIQLQQLLQHSCELLRWNKRINLTAITQSQQVLTHHILDSLSVLPFIHGQRVLDVGTGGGFPGIPLAICRPQLHLTLIDCVAKKCYFLQHICHLLHLTNTTIIHQRIDDFSPGQCFDTIVARAWTSLSEICAKTLKFLAPGGQIISMKGTIPQAELAELSQPYRIQPVTVPGLGQQRHMIIIEGT